MKTKTKKNKTKTKFNAAKEMLKLRKKNLYPHYNLYMAEDSNTPNLPERKGVWDLQDVYDETKCKGVSAGSKVLWPKGFEKNKKLDFYQLQMWTQLLSGEKPEESEEEWAKATSFGQLAPLLKLSELHRPCVTKEEMGRDNAMSFELGDHGTTNLYPEQLDDEVTVRKGALPFERFIYSAT